MTEISAEANQLHDCKERRDWIDVTYRLVYLRPSMHSDEALTVGVLLAADGKNYLRTIQSELAYNSLGQLFGENGKEQVAFALESLRRCLSHGSSELGSDLISLGEANIGACEDPESFARDVLEVSSSLFRTYSSPVVADGYITQEEIPGLLYENVTQLDALKATRLFQGVHVPLSSQSRVKIPISGDKVIGASVSLATRQIGGARTQAEALIAKCCVAARIVGKRPAVYLLAPNAQLKINQKEVDATLSELEAISNGHGVLLRRERSLPDLAQALLRDDAA